MARATPGEVGLISSRSDIFRPPTPVAEPAARPRAGGVKLNTIEIEGVRSLPLEIVQQSVESFESRTLELPDLAGIARAIEKVYRDRGYVLVRAVVPPQKVVGGVLKVKVAEGRIAHVKISGNKQYSDRFIRRFFEPALRTGVVNVHPIHRALLVLDEFEDLTVQSIFSAGSEPGTADVELRVKDRSPVHYGVDYNNYGNVAGGKNRAAGTLYAGNALVEGDSLVLRTVVSFPSDSDPFYQAVYSAPVGNRGDRLSLQLATAKTKVGDALAVLDIRGTADIYGLIYQHPIHRTLSRSSNLTAGVVSKTIKNFVFGNVPLSADDLRVATVGYGGSEVRAKHRTIHSENISQGLGSLLNGSGKENRLASRAGATNSFTKLNADVLHVVQLDGNRFALLRAGGQAAPSGPLATAEQFSIGGAETVRGFDQSVFLGDEGYTLSGELRQGLISKPEHSIQAAAFIDHGHASLKRPGRTDISRASLTGAGVGLRGSFVDNKVSVKVDMGFPLDVSGIADTRRSIFYGQLYSRF